jgi:hypothetical protein
MVDNVSLTRGVNQRVKSRVCLSLDTRTLAAEAYPTSPSFSSPLVTPLQHSTLFPRPSFLLIVTHSRLSLRPSTLLKPAPHGPRRSRSAAWRNTTAPRLSGRPSIPPTRLASTFRKGQALDQLEVQRACNHHVFVLVFTRPSQFHVSRRSYPTVDTHLNTVLTRLM